MSGTGAPAMVGRRAQLQALRNARDAALRGEPQVVVIGGEAGIGKTRLVDEFAAEVSGSGLTARGVCVDLGDAGTPFIAIRAILRGLVTALGEDAVRQSAGSAPAALMTLVGGTDAAVEGPADGTAGRLREGFLRLIENVSATRPLLLILEDVHWADSSTLSLVQYVTRLIRDARVLVLVTVRTGELPRGHRADLAELERLRTVTRLELPPLSRTDVGVWAGERDDASVALLHERSGGIPFFVEELLGAADGAVPRTVSDLIAIRYERLDPAAQHVLRLLAIGGLRVEYDLLEAVYGGDSRVLDDAVRSAADGGLLVTERHGCAFRHALVREVIDHELMPGERSRFHARFAQALTDRPRADSHAEVSSHWLAARRIDESFAAACRAMDDAVHTFALATEAAMAERCVNLWEQASDPEAASGGRRGEMLVRAARAHRASGNDERALVLTRMALEEVAEEPARVTVELLNAEGLDLYRLGLPGSADTFTRALTILDGIEDDDALVVRTEVLANLSAAQMMAGESAEALRTAEAAVDAGLAAGPVAHTSASIGANIAGVSLVDLDRVDEGLARFDQALELAGDEWAPRARWAINLSDTLNLLGRPREAVAVAEAELDEARARGEERGTGIMLATNTVEALFALGEWERARSLLDRALSGDAPMAFRRYLEHLRLWFLIWTDELDEARRWNDAVRAEHDRIGKNERQVETGTAFDAAQMYLADGDAVRAFAVLEPLVWDGRTDRPTDRLLGIATLAHAYRDLKDAGRTPPRTPDEFRTVMATVRRHPSLDAWRAVVEAEIDENPVTRIDRWDRAIELIAQGQAHRHLVGVGLLRQADALVACGERAQALERLTRAREESATLGALLISRLAEERAARIGGAIRRATPDLTPRETQVLQLVAQGLTNPQIGERLYISAKTASVHVSALLRKLGAANRAEAAARAADLLDPQT